MPRQRQRKDQRTTETVKYLITLPRNKVKSCLCEKTAHWLRPEKRLSKNRVPVWVNFGSNPVFSPNRKKRKTPETACFLGFSWLRGSQSAGGRRPATDRVDRREGFEPTVSPGLRYRVGRFEREQVPSAYQEPPALAGARAGGLVIVRIAGPVTSSLFLPNPHPSSAHGPRR